MTRSDADLLERLLPTLATALAPLIVEKIATMQEPFARRLAGVEAACESLRASVVNSATRRRFVGLDPDPDLPGNSLLRLDDGSAVSLPDQRLREIASIASPIGHA